MPINLPIKTSEPRARTASDEGVCVPRHVALIMDGNRRWAKKRLMPAAMGHAAGAARVRDLVKTCLEMGIAYVSLFAFSTENWRRSEEEVSGLMKLFMTYLRREVGSLNSAGVRLWVVGDRSRFSQALQDLIEQAELRTAQNTQLTLLVCANYGGRSDFISAVRAWQASHPELSLKNLSEEALEPHFGTREAPEVDLIIRTGGESRISNFLLWQAAYAELYFTDELWPDFGPEGLVKAIQWFAKRERRFGVNIGKSI